MTEVGGSNPIKMGKTDSQVRIPRETLETLVEQCQTALQLLRNSDEPLDSSDLIDDDDDDSASVSSSQRQDLESDELCELLKARVESPNFLEKLGSVHLSVSNGANDEGSSSWDVVSESDLWGVGNTDGENEFDQDGYVLVRQEDIVEGIACFMAAYLLSLKQTKELTPNELQEALSKTFSLKKKRGKLQKAWDGSKMIYNVASWSATAIGIYQNPALFKAASMAFWTSCRVVSKLL